MYRLIVCLGLLAMFTLMPFVPAESAPAPLPAAKTKIVLLPIINSSQISDDWVTEHIQNTLAARFPLEKYDYADPSAVAALLRDNGYTAGFGAMPDKDTLALLAGNLNASACLGLEISRIAYETTNMSLTATQGKEKVTTILKAAIYTAKDDGFLAYSTKKSVDKKVGPFKPYEKNETITAGLDLCTNDIINQINF